MQNWYKIAKLDQRLRREAGWGQDLTKALSASVLSALLLVLEFGAINRQNVDKAAQKAHLNDQEKKQLEQVVQDPNVMNQAKEFMYKPQTERPSMEINVPPIPKYEEPASEVSTAPIIDLGKELIGRGYKVGYHPNFSYGRGFDKAGKQRVGEHSAHSFHYRNQAFDISGASAEDLKSLFDELYAKRQSLGLTEIIYDGRGHWFSKSNKFSSRPYGGHGTHIHVAFNTPGLIQDVGSVKNPD